MGSFRTGGNYADADPRLVSVIEAAAAQSPYDVIMFSGARSGGGSSQHDHAKAVDIVLIDPSTGQRIPNLGAGGEAFQIYEQFAQLARQVQQEVAPQLNDTFRWGGYFGPSSLNPTGADLMHFDLGSSSNMRFGSWEGGLNAEGQQFVANLGAGQVYSDVGRTNADGTMTYANLFGRAPLTGPAPGTTTAGLGGQMMNYAPGGAPPQPITGAAAAAEGMASGGGGEGLPTIRRGAGSRDNPDPNVRALQEFLNQNGQNVAVDGIFGGMTERAVRAYQEANGLGVDGVVGPQTWGHIAGTSVASSPTGAADGLPGPVRGFVERVFGDGAAGNLVERINMFREGVRKGLSPTDAFTQARGQPIQGTPVAGSVTAGLPPRTAPIPPENPARPPAPIIPQPRANPERLGPTQGPTMPGQVQVQGPVIPGPVQGPVVPQEGVGPIIPPMQGPPSGPTQGPVMPSAMQGPFNDPALMPQGRPESTVPTTPSTQLGEGEYLPEEWVRLRQLQGNQAQNPAYARPPGARPALIPDQSSPRMDAYSIKPLRREEGPLQPSTTPPWGEEPGYSFMRRSGFASVDGPPGPAAPAQFGAPPPAPIIPQAKVPQMAPPNPTPYPAKPFTYDQFAGVEAPPAPPPTPEARPAFVPAAPPAKAPDPAINMRLPQPPAPVDLRVAAPKAPAIPPPPIVPLVPAAKAASPPKPIIPAVKKKAA